MNNSTSIFIALIFIFMSCDKSDDDTGKCENSLEETEFNATVLGPGQDCGDSFLIQFNDDVEGVPENPSFNTFYELNLPSEYKLAGLEIYAEFREPEMEELIICTHEGFSFPLIYIISVE